MKRLLLSGIAVVMLAPPVARAQTAWTNQPFGIITDVSEIPQSVTTFINYGQISLATLVPFETYDTLNFTNSGTMSASPGWRFGYVPLSGNGPRQMAANFVNLNAGSITALDPLAAGVVCVVASIDPSYLLISATNIINRAVGTTGASLIAGANGGLELTGKSVDLTRSGLLVQPIVGTGDAVSAVNPYTNYIPDVSIYDSYWGQGEFSEDLPLNSGALWNGTTASAPAIPPPPNGAVDPAGSLPLTLFNPVADSYINALPNSTAVIVITNFTGSPTNVTSIVTRTIVASTNITKGAVFVSPPAGFSAQVGFSPGEDFLNSAGVLISGAIQNEVTGLGEPVFISVTDTLAADFDDRGVAVNEVGCPPTGFRPNCYLFNRLAILPGGAGNNGFPAADFFTSSFSFGLSNPGDFGFDGVTNAFLEDGDYAAYGLVLDNVVTRPPAVPGGTVTNLPGRIRIKADSLNMERTRMRAEGELRIETPNLISSSNAVVDSESLSFNLNSADGNLKVQSLSKDFVERFRGPVYLFSAVWQNSANWLITNNYSFTNIVSTNAMGVEVTNIIAIQESITNTVAITMHTLMVDASQVQFTVPVTVYDLVSHSTNSTTISDNMSVVSTLLIESENLTLAGNLTIPGFLPADPLTGLIPIGGALQRWVSTNAPNLRRFTNSGTMFVYSDAHFGDDRAVPYSTFVNSGTIDGASVLVKSDYFENRGQLTAPSVINIQGGTGRLENGASTSGGDTIMDAGDVKLSGYTMQSGQTLTLRVTNSLSDAGPGSFSFLDAPFGFNLPIKPTAGDLLGTTLQSITPRFFSVTHTWAGEDRGDNVSGYSNNVAVGTLFLSTSDNFGLHVFQGAGAQNGLYVDLLDISSLGADYPDNLEIDPGLVIYYAAASVGFTPTNSMLPEEALDGQLGGRLQWVSSFAGPNSSTNVVLPGGQVVRMNLALRNSVLIDSDGDGLANAYDPSPLDPSVTMLAGSVAGASPLTFAVSWVARPQTVYNVEFRTDQTEAWQLLRKYTNSAAMNDKVTVYDQVPPGSQQRFYRVSYNP